MNAQARTENTSRVWSPRIEPLEEVEGSGTGKELFSLICSHGFGFPPHITLNNEAGREGKERLGGRGRGQQWGKKIGERGSEADYT